MELSTGRGTVMPYIVRLKRSDGTVLNLPDIFAGPTPAPQTEVPVHVDGELVVAKVERHSQWHTASPEMPVERVDVVIASQVHSRIFSGET
jgi:hypothetical protein